MKIFRIADVQRCQKSENIGLNCAYQKLQRADKCDEENAEQRNAPACTAGIDGLDHEACEHLDQDMAGDHRHEQPQREAERTNEEGQKLYRENQRHHPQRRTVRDEQAEELEAVLPETDDQNDREADCRKQAGYGELASHGERVDAGDDAERHHAEKIGKQDEHEQGEDPRRIFPAIGANAVGDDIVDKADYAFNHHLPATGNQLALHSADHEHVKQPEDDEHPQCTIGEANLLTKESEAIKDGLHFKLVHRINFAFGSH